MKSLHVNDSYLVNDVIEIYNILAEYCEHQQLSVKYRDFPSYYREWIAHNGLYEHGIFKSHTKDVDLEFKINPILEIGYWLIYKLSELA